MRQKLWSTVGGLAIGFAPHTAAAQSDGGALTNLGNGSFVYYFGTMAAIALLVFAAAAIVDRHIEPIRLSRERPAA